MTDSTAARKKRKSSLDGNPLTGIAVLAALGAVAAVSVASGPAHQASPRPQQPLVAEFKIPAAVGVMMNATGLR